MVSTIFGWCLLLVNLPRIHTEVNHTWDHSQKQFFMQSRVCGSGQLSYLPNKSDIPGKKDALVPNDCDLSESDKHKNTGTTLVTVIWFSYILEMTSVPQINKKMM